MRSLAATAENAKEVLTTPGGWLSVGQGFLSVQVRTHISSGKREGKGGGGTMGSQRLFACFPSRALISFIPFVAEALLGQFPLRGI